MMYISVADIARLYIQSTMSHWKVIVSEIVVAFEMVWIAYFSSLAVKQQNETKK